MILSVGPAPSTCMSPKTDPTHPGSDVGTGSKAGQRCRFVLIRIMCCQPERCNIAESEHRADRTAWLGDVYVDSFFERPILNSPYVYPGRHWELDEEGQPTNRIIETRRRSKLIMPVPKPQRRRRTSTQPEPELEFGRDGGLSTPEQEYDVPRLINEIRGYVDNWRHLPNPNQWQVTPPETVRLLQHWRHHQFNSVKPFFCQIEAVETAIWLAEVASDRAASGARLCAHIRGANREANPELLRIALKLATGAGKTTVMAM